LSRGNSSYFDPNLGCLKSRGVAAFKWGLVDGQSQTIYPWDSRTKSYESEPALWFHNIFRRKGDPCRAQEVAYNLRVKRGGGASTLFLSARLVPPRWRH
jgi:hypothetical protein